MTNLENKLMDKYKYPGGNDMKFQKKISLKKEFKYPYVVPKITITSMDKKNKLCKKEGFTLSPHQEFVKNFIHPNTPYNGILLYHGMGSGKTCTTIGVSEQFRNIHKYNPSFKKIWVLASEAVQDNFRLQLFDPDKLTKKNGVWTLESCVGPNLLQELQNHDLQNMTKDMVANKIYKNIDEHYQFLGYEKFANEIQNIIRNITTSDEKKKRKAIKQKLNKEYGNSLLIIDEAHNIRIKGNDTEKKKTAQAIQVLTTNVKHNKILLLTGTPMYNDSQEIIFLLNLLRSNDGISPIKPSEIFDKDGNLLVIDGEEVGKQNLMMKANGYVSFVRGENPYRFPFKIYPNDYDSPSSIGKFKYPEYQHDGKNITQPITFLDLYISPMSEFQKMGYEYFRQKSHKSIKASEEQHEEQPEEPLDETAFSSGYTKHQNALYSLNICYPGEKEGQFLNGITGLSSIVSQGQNDKFTYIDKENNIFDYEKIGNYSAKIKTILDLIIKSDGIILIYSQYKSAGLLPIALALEEIGMNRINSKDNLFANRNNKSINLRYSMITGDKKYSKNNSQEIKVINNNKNSNGDLCKVVLISQAGSEGIDFKNLRQVHILEPWHNLNRIDQIVGRAIRDCSHKDLPLSKRNCQIFMHGSYIDENEEPIDMFYYRRSEKKAMKIGLVQKVLKSISVDCIINEKQKQFSNLKEKIPIMELATKDVIKKFPVKDKPYSLVCDYQKDCDYKCLNTITPGVDIEDKSTYSYLHTKNNQLVDKIKKLFLKKHVYRFEEIVDIFELNENDLEQVYSTLTHLVKNNTEIVFDKYGKKGNIMNVKNLYIFQPLEFGDSYTSLYDKMRPLKHKPSRINVTSKAPKNFENKYALMNKPHTINASADNDKLQVNKSEQLLISMKSMYETGLVISEKDKTKGFYENYSRVIEKLNELSPKIKITTTQKKQWLIQHLIETIPFKKELSFVNYLLKRQEEDEFASSIKAFYKKHFIFSFLNGEILFLVDVADNKAEIGDKVHLYDSHVKLYYKPDDEDDFRILKTSEKMEGQKRITSILKQIRVDKSKISNVLVFVGFNEKDKEEPIQLKIKEIESNYRSKKIRGRIVKKNELPKTLIPKIDKIIGEKTIGSNKTKKFSQEQLTVGLGILSNYFTNKDKIIYINKLQFAENNIREL